MHVNIEIFGRLRRPGGRQYYIRGSTREEWLLDLQEGIVPLLPPPPLCPRMVMVFEKEST